MRKCIKCERVLPETNYYSTSTNRCKVCTREYQRQYHISKNHSDNPDVEIKSKHYEDFEYSQSNADMIGNLIKFLIESETIASSRKSMEQIYFGNEENIRSIIADYKLFPIQHLILQQLDETAKDFVSRS